VHKIFNGRKQLVIDQPITLQKPAIRRKVSRFATFLPFQGAMRRSELLIAFVISFLAILGTPSEAAGTDVTIRGRVDEPASRSAYNGRYVYTRVELRGR
jgi:hypothetical protein